MPNEGTNPWDAFTHTHPQNAAGIRALPPSSTPRAMSTSPAVTAAPTPPDEPPAECVGLRGLRGGPNTLDSPNAPADASSRFSLPVIVPPASRIRSTTTASSSGVYDIVRDPLLIGIPATAMLSLTPIRFPSSGPADAP